MRWKTSATTTLPLTRNDAYVMLTAYDQYQDWLPEVTHSRVLAREGDIAVVELVSPLLMEGSLVLEVVHTPPEAAIFSQADRYRRRGISGGWQLRSDGNSQSPGSVVLSIEVEIPANFVNPGPRQRARAAINAALATLHARSASLAPGISDERRKILEVVRQADGLQVWLRGETFTLSPKPEARKR
jgi:hypothetical protein